MTLQSKTLLLLLLFLNLANCYQNLTSDNVPRDRSKSSWFSDGGNGTVKGTTKQRRQSRSRHSLTRLGPNGPAFNNGDFDKQRFQNVSNWVRIKRKIIKCCKKVIVSASGPASKVQWDRLGLYTSTGQTSHGRTVYQHENWTQSIFYMYGEYDGWLLGPQPNVNFGGIKNSHDKRCVHTGDGVTSGGWGYFDGPRDTRDPDEAFPYWKQDDQTLSVRCVPKSINIDSRKVPDLQRGPMLRYLFWRVRVPLRKHCGPLLSRGKLNMEAWLVTTRCGGECHNTSIALHLATGQADILLVATRYQVDLASYCFQCHLYWAGRLLTGQSASWSADVPGETLRLYVILVGYSEYVSLNVKMDSPNVLRTTAKIVR